MSEKLFTFVQQIKKTMTLIIENIIKEYVTKSKKKDFWSGSPFEQMLKLSSDERGELGEKMLYKMLSLDSTNLSIIWEGNQNINRKDGSIWDILINDIRTEVKTAMRNTSSKTWQHEKIVEENCWDKIVFIDIDYSGIWFTIQSHSEIPFRNNKHKIINKKSTYHLGGWKFDLSQTQIKKLEHNGYSFYYDTQSPNVNGFLEFIKLHFCS